MPETDPTALDRALTAALPPGSLYAVGGRVRDEVRSALDGIPRPAKDLDYVVVGLDLAELVAALVPVGKTDVVGATFAVVKCTIDGTTVDLALPRRERSTGPGHRDFVVESGPSVRLEDDLARRDFRMNMLARALPEGRLVDPYGGEADVRNHRIDLLRPSAFEEDPLRMLRACQFAARFEYTVTPATLAAMRASAPAVATVSPERVREELLKILGAPRPSLGLEVMRAGGLLDYVLPELAACVGVEQNEWHAYDVYRHSLQTVDASPLGDEVLRLAALLHDIGKPSTKDGPHFYRHEIVGEAMVTAMLERLRFGNETVATVGALVRNHMYSADPTLSDAGLRRFARRVGVERLERQFALRAADILGSGLRKRGDNNERFEARVRALLAQRPPLGLGDLAIDGRDVIRELIASGLLPVGSKGGPLVGEVLRRVLERTLDEPDLDREGQLAVARVAVGTFHGEHSREAEMTPRDESA